MNGMDIVDASGTIDPANLSNTGMFSLLIIYFSPSLAFLPCLFPGFIFDRKLFPARPRLCERTTWTNPIYISNYLLSLYLNSPSLLSN